LLQRKQRQAVKDAKDDFLSRLKLHPVISIEVKKSPDGAVLLRSCEPVQIVLYDLCVKSHPCYIIWIWKVTRSDRYLQAKQHAGGGVEADNSDSLLPGSTLFVRWMKLDCQNGADRK
jgi:hypothetical protein